MLPNLTAIVSAVAILMATGTSAAPPQDLSSRQDPSVPVPNRMIALNARSACDCPNNCSYRKGHSCKYHLDFSDQGPVFEGTCDFNPDKDDGKLWCL